uniref:Cbp1 family collagen-binding glycoprotein adhesin n=1 Tax=Fulvivirga sp. TaxID=1931237 RepID=UPI004049D03E
MRTLKTYFSVMIIVMVALVSCNQEKVDQLSEENQQLSTEKADLNAQLETYMKTFNDIESNLAEIKEREEKINLKTSDNVEDRKDAKTAIVEDIQAINGLMLENKQKINQLQNELESTDSEFRKMVASLNRRVKEKDSEIVTLKTDLEQLNIEKKQLAQAVVQLETSVDTLENKTAIQRKVIDAQTSIIADKENALNTAYVAVGTYKDLKENKVINKEGGILGIGSTEKLNDDFNQEAFNKIDIKDVTIIPLASEKAELVTTHPKDSYQLAMDDVAKTAQLHILNPDEFWASSKYLVLMVN